MQNFNQHIIHQEQNQPNIAAFAHPENDYWFSALGFEEEDLEI